MRELSYEEALGLRSPAFVDVRAPVEFAQDHIPGAISLPVFDDEERAQVGTLYRLRGQESAIIKGTEMVSAKLAGIVENITRLKGRDIVITCFRGGMRSTALVSLLLSLGIGVYKLRDGHKGYRRYIKSRIGSLALRPPVFVLHGLTGTGKTEILRSNPNGIDLEGAAGHRSSVFGAIGLTPNSQKMFESLLVHRIDELKAAPFVLFEGESRKIGDIHLPGRLMKEMDSSPGILITASMERRVQILLKEYERHMDAGAAVSNVKSIEGRIGKKNAALLLELFQKGDLPEFAGLLLKKYYDPLYSYSLDKMNFIARIENDDAESAAKSVGDAIERFLSGGGVQEKGRSQRGEIF